MFATDTLTLSGVVAVMSVALVVACCSYPKCPFCESGG